MKTIPRILIAVLASFLFNVLLLVVLYVGYPEGKPSRFWRFMDAITEPPTFVANALFQSPHAHKDGTRMGGCFYSLFRCSYLDWNNGLFTVSHIHACQLLIGRN